MLSLIVEADEGGEDEEDYPRLSELITLAEAGLLAQDQQADDVFVSQAADEAEPFYDKT